jgi:hypothetical protein
MSWGGVPLDARMAEQMDEVVRLCGSQAPVRATQGCYSGGGVQASAGTHDGCGAIDIAGEGLTDHQRALIRDAGRMVGLAMWIRTPYQSDWPWHLHGISVQPGGKADSGCLSSGAHGQVVDYFEGRNGLASGAPDDGPRQWVGVTWETYAGQGDWFDMATEAELAQIVNDCMINVLRGGEAQQIIRDQVDQQLRHQFNNPPDGPHGECFDRVVQAAHEAFEQRNP